MKFRGSLSRVLSAMTIFALCVFSGQANAAEPSCRTGGIHAATAFVLANPLYAIFFGDLPAYLAQNPTHFRAGGDAVRCSAALSRALMSSAVQLYDPADIQRKQELDIRLRQNGINPGPQQPDAASMLFSTSMQLSRLARVLPAAADGDYTPMNTPTNQIEEMQIFAEAMLRMLLQDPSTMAALAPVEPLIREAAQFEHFFIRQAAARLANAP